MEDNIERSIIQDGSQHEVTPMPLIKVRISSLTRRDSNQTRLYPREETTTVKKERPTKKYKIRYKAWSQWSIST